MALNGIRQKLMQILPGVYFADAVSVFEDDFAITIRDADLEQKERWITLGIDALRQNPCCDLRLARRSHQAYFGAQS